MPGCEGRVSALPVLTYPKVGCAPVLELHPSRLGLSPIPSANSGRIR